MPTPAVSIIVPAFNRGRYLAESIESVLNQTFSDWELIVVDDGSSDSMPTIIERYRLRFPERVKPICQANSGVAAARNTGSRLSTATTSGIRGRQ
jgi:glycosyltransferase involved in cell wall biosynthesis